MQQVSNKIRLAPTDLSNFLGCRHLSCLDLESAKGLTVRPVRYGPLFDELKARGIVHEQRYLEHLRAQGLSISEIERVEQDGQSTETGLERTLTAMRSGEDVIYQAILADENWSGRADFMRKVETPSNLGNWSYEVTDTKLAHDTRAGTILQLCVYSYLLEKPQGRRPEFMHVCHTRKSIQTIDLPTG